MSNRAFLLILVATSPLLAQMSDSEWEKTKSQAIADIDSSDPATRSRAVKSIATGERREAAELLIRVRSIAAGHAAPLVQRQAQVAQRILTYLDKKSLTSSDQSNLERLLQEQKEVGGKIALEDAVRNAVPQALGMLNDAEAIAWLVATPMKGSSWEERAAVAEACGSLIGPGVVPALIERVGTDGDVRVKAIAIDSLRRKGATEAAGAIGKALSTPAWELQASALQALAELGSKEGIEPIVLLMAGADGRLKHECARALARITGEGLGLDAAAWKKWWADNKDGWSGRKPGQAPPVRDPGGTTASYYGIPVESTRLVFVVDISGSMSEPADLSLVSRGSGESGEDSPPRVGSSKLEVAKYELKKVVRRLDAKASFNLIFFSNTPSKWQGNLVQATPQCKAAAVKFIDGLTPEGATNIYDSLEMAFSMGLAGGGHAVSSGGGCKDGVDTIYLLSDGAPNLGQYTDTTQILAKVGEMARLRRVLIHVVGVGSGQDESFMRKLAEENGGQYVKR